MPPAIELTNVTRRFGDITAVDDLTLTVPEGRAGEIANFTGVSAPYEEPLEPELMVDTAKETLEESGQRVLDFLKREGIIN